MVQQNTCDKLKIMPQLSQPKYALKGENDHLGSVHFDLTIEYYNSFSSFGYGDLWFWQLGEKRNWCEKRTQQVNEIFDCMKAKYTCPLTWTSKFSVFLDTALSKPSKNWYYHNYCVGDDGGRVEIKYLMPERNHKHYKDILSDICYANVIVEGYKESIKNKTDVPTFVNMQEMYSGSCTQPLSTSSAKAPYNKPSFCYAYYQVEEKDETWWPTYTCNEYKLDCMSGVLHASNVTGYCKDSHQPVWHIEEL